MVLHTVDRLTPKSSATSLRNPGSAKELNNSNKIWLTSTHKVFMQATNVFFIFGICLKIIGGAKVIKIENAHKEKADWMTTLVACVDVLRWTCQRFSERFSMKEQVLISCGFWLRFLFFLLE